MKEIKKTYREIVEFLRNSQTKIRWRWMGRRFDADHDIQKKTIILNQRLIVFPTIHEAIHILHPEIQEWKVMCMEDYLGIHWLRGKDKRVLWKAVENKLRR